jgi:hypothetical protein
MYENDIQITGVEFTDTDEDRTLYLAGTDTYTLDLTGNMLIDGSTASDVLNGIYNVVHNFGYRPFTATVVTAPYLWPMDRVTFTDMNGGGHVSLLTNVNLTINGNTTIAANGETIQASSMARPSGFTNQQSTILQKIRRVNSTDLNEAVDKATALITGANGGFVRFIYDEEDNLTEIVIMDTNDITTATKVWRWNSGGLGYSKSGYAGPYTTAMTQDGSIVADFITSGRMSANVIRAGLLTDATGTNLWDLDNGIFRLAGDSTLDGRKISKLIEDIDATITSVDIEFAQNQSATIPPVDGWTTEAPSWAAGYYIWQRTVTTSPGGVYTSEPTCISGRDGSESTPGLNQATIYLYKRAASQPAKPSVNTVYTFVNGVLAPLPDGWTRGIPNGSDPCWVTSATAISTDTTDNIPASEWLTPTMFVENGSDGSSIDTVVNYYAVSSTTTPPDDFAFWMPGVPVLWTDNYGNVITAGASGNLEFMPTDVPVPTELDPYVWQYQLTTYTDGSTTRSNKYVSAILGESGVGISDIVEEYYLSTSNTSQVGGEWSTQQPEWVSGLYIWTRTVITWTDDKVTTTEPILAKAINGANEKAQGASEAAIKAQDSISNLDSSLNQTGVFNRLTNNGAVQGIYLENNQLYINGTYIKTGTIDAGLIAAGSLTISQLDAGAKSAIVTGVTTKSQYYLSTSSTSAKGGEWTDAMPVWVSGTYVFTRIRTTKNYADGSSVSTNSDAIYDANLTTALSTSTSAKATADGAAASVTVKTQYYLSTSSQTAKGGEWKDEVPAWSSGKFVFTRTATTTTPVVGSATTTYSDEVYDANLTTALSTAAAAQASANGAIASTGVKMQYCLATSSTTPPIGGWQDTVPTWSSGKYIWTRIATSKTTVGGTPSTSYSSPLYDPNLTTALRTANSAAELANSAVVSSVTCYYRSTSNTTPTISTATAISETAADADNTWTYVMPRPKNGCYFYTCERYTHVDSSVTFSTVRSIENANYTSLWCSSSNATYIDGAHIYTGSVTADQIAAGTITVSNLTKDAKDLLVSNTETKVQYYLSDSDTEATGGSWSDNPAGMTTDKYIWTRVATVITRPDGTTTTSTVSDGVYDENLTMAYVMADESFYRANNAKDAADAAQATADAAAYRQQIIYRSAASGTTSMQPYTYWVTQTSAEQNSWTTTRPVYSSSYPVVFVAVQRQSTEQYNGGSGTSCSCTTPVMDNTTTVIDGHHITTGTIDAARVNVANINASNITSGTIDASKISVTNLSASNITSGSLSADRIQGGTLTLGGANNVNGQLVVKNASGASIATLNNTGANIAGTFTTTDYNPDPETGANVSIRLANGKLQCLQGSNSVLELGYDGHYELFALRPGGTAQDVFIDAETANSSGEVTGGSSIRVSKSGGIDLFTNYLYVRNMNHIGGDYGKTVDVYLDGYTLSFINGILVGY